MYNDAGSCSCEVICHCRSIRNDKLSHLVHTRIVLVSTGCQTARFICLGCHVGFVRVTYGCLLPLQVVEAALRALRMLLRSPGLMQRASVFLWEATVPSANTSIKSNAKGSGGESGGTSHRDISGVESSNGNGATNRDPRGSLLGTDNSTGSANKEGLNSPWIFKPASGVDKGALDGTAQLLLHLLQSKSDAVAEVSTFGSTGGMFLH